MRVDISQKLIIMKGFRQRVSLAIHRHTSTKNFADNLCDNDKFKNVYIFSFIKTSCYGEFIKKKEKNDKMVKK